MNKLRTVIIDDEPDGVDVIQFFLKENQHIEIIGSANSVKNGIDLIQEVKPDLVLLDIEMPEGNGFDVLNAFEKPSFKVVFVTGYDQYAIKAIKYSAIDYLLKPVSQSELTEAVDRVKEIIEEEDIRLKNLKEITSNREKIMDRIIISSHSGFRTIMLDQIVSIESRSGNYALFYTKENQEYLCTKPIKYYENLFPTNLFNRIHKSYIINLSYVTNYNNKSGQVTLLKDRIFEVAFRRRSRFNDAYKAKFSS